MERYDFHCHTTCSDGSLSVEELLRLAKSRNLTGLSITDHDSINAYKEAIPLARELGLWLMSGVEFSAMQENESIHILAYGFSLDDPHIQALCERHEKRRHDRNRAILERLGQQRMPLTEADVLAEAKKGATIGRPHIALAMVRKGYIKTPAEAFKKYLSEGKSGYVAGAPITVDETLAVIHAGKALAVLAHPHLIPRNRIVKQLLTMPFDGIECYYARFSEGQCRDWVERANARGWLVTGGSDFHGASRPETLLGASWTPEETIKLMQERGYVGLH